MRAIISILTAAAFVLHLGLGCCAHHAHACAHLPTATEDDHGCSHHGHGHGHLSHDAPDSPSQRHAPDSPCDESDCAFAAASKLTLTKAWLTAGMHFLGAVPAVEVELAPACECRSGCELAWALPLRVHLLHQVLLN